MGFHVQATDDDLHTLAGCTLESETWKDTRYRLETHLSGGSMGIVYYAVRSSPQGESPSVVKIMRPSFALNADWTASMVFRKEAVALGRLNERVPPTPFVVRMLDVGTAPIDYEAGRLGLQAIALPWLALEYVHGGAEGTTLRERVEQSVAATGHGFDLSRSARAVECLLAALEAIHDVGVVHRDLKPENVLCCGFGGSEVFKVTDFGIARPAGFASTFGASTLGTPGYGAPELMDEQAGATGVWTDVFAAAAIVFFLLTGEELFAAKNPIRMLLLVNERTRTSVLQTKGLAPEWRRQEEAARRIDEVILRATSPVASERPQSARELAELLLPAFRAPSRRIKPESERLASVQSAWATARGSWRWQVLHRPGDDHVVRSVAWGSDGRCLAATTRGLSFWNGTDWLEAPTKGFPCPTGIRFVRCGAPGEWLIGGDEGSMAVYTAKGVGEVIQSKDRSTCYESAAGDIDDVAVVVALSSSAPPVLYGLASRKWVRGCRLHDVAHVISLARIDDSLFVIAGRCNDGEGFAGQYDPLAGQVERFSTPSTRAFLASAGLPERGQGLLAGTAGAVVRVQRGGLRAEHVGEDVALSAATVDAAGRAWAAGAGAIWFCEDGAARWQCIWREPAWVAPIISLYAEPGVVVGVAADGAILEGRQLR